MQQYTQLIFLVAMVAVFWLLIFRPQQQRAKRQREMMSALKVGDEIVTVGGIFATIVEVGERLRVQVLDGSELEIARQAVGQVLGASSSESVQEPLDESRVSADDEVDDQPQASQPQPPAPEDPAADA
jgi:preprotein translocase subunit YajC